MARGRSTGNGACAVQDSAAKLGFEAKLWQAADALRNNMDAAEYKHVALGLIFLKYISDVRGETRRVDAQRGEGAGPGRVPRKNISGAAGSALSFLARRSR
jgi:hypothetical protein